MILYGVLRRIIGLKSFGSLAPAILGIMMMYARFRHDMSTLLLQKEWREP